ncbi:MAG: hypothetical protein ACRD3P_04065 [Terriglobales bacterium]
MKCISVLFATVLFLMSWSAVAQQPAPRDAASTDNPDRGTITVRGCLTTERGNYILIADRTSTVYAMQSAEFPL